MSNPSPKWAKDMLAFLDEDPDNRFADWHNLAAHLGCGADEVSVRFALELVAIQEVDR